MNNFVANLIIQKITFEMKEGSNIIDRLHKKGYKEIYSRLGRKFIELKGVGSTDVNQICQANRITDKAQIKEIFEDSEFDLRRVKRKVHAIKQINQKA